MKIINDHIIHSSPCGAFNRQHGSLKKVLLGALGAVKNKISELFLAAVLVFLGLMLYKIMLMNPPMNTKRLNGELGTYEADAADLNHPKS